ncbi:MAG: Fe-S cluster assembly protein SufD [Anaerolineaceae bacterium]
MNEKIIVTKSRRQTKELKKSFRFTYDMIPGISENGRMPAFLKDFRLRGWKAYQEIPLPTTSDEAWRRTDLRDLDTGVFRIPAAGEHLEFPLVPDELSHTVADQSYGGQIILQPSGEASIKLASPVKKQGVVFTTIKNAERICPDILANVMGQIVKPEESKFAGMAASFAENGILVYIPPGIKVEKPLQSILWGPGVGLAYFSHIIVWVNEGASLTYVHESSSPTEKKGQTMHSGLVEILVSQNASLKFIELQSWGEHVWNFSHERAQVHRYGNIEWIFGAMGSHVTKNFTDLDLIGEGATGKVTGFYFADGVQHFDHDTQQNHLAPQTTSDLLYKGALKDKSYSVWQGMIYVSPHAQKTDGYQANRNLTLSPLARADSIPGLEILANDVRCTHGVTVGKVDAEQMFYLQSRGISKKDGERLIIEGFFDPIMQRIPFESMRSRFQNAIYRKLE